MEEEQGRQQSKRHLSKERNFTNPLLPSFFSLYLASRKAFKMINTIPEDLN
jgi:hypothetical protein